MNAFNSKNVINKLHVVSFKINQRVRMVRPTKIDGKTPQYQSFQVNLCCSVVVLISLMTRDSEKSLGDAMKCSGRVNQA